MRFFGFGNRLDKAINPYININSKRKLPVIICHSGNAKIIRNKIASNNGKIKYEYENINALACELSPAAIDKLSEVPDISFICFDHKASLCLRKSHDALGMGYAKMFKLTGRGIGIGIIDSGVFPHEDLTASRRSIHRFEDLINGHTKPYDDNGHGTFIAGCISSSGHMSGGMYMGIAPDSNICMIKAFDASGNGFLSDIVRGIDLLIKMKKEEEIRIICLPFELPYINKLKVNPLEVIIKKAIENNIAVVTPSGNLGPQPYSIYCPGNIPEVITVGGIDCKDNNLKNYRVTGFSGRGPTIAGITKPDFAAPCFNITSLSSDITYLPNSKRVHDLKTPYTSMSGTSISCALICGAAALILEKTPELTPSDLKSILCLSTISVGENKYAQGSGIFVFDKIVK